MTAKGKITRLITS